MIFDTDAHVEESEETFAALRGREEFAQSAPQIIEGHKRGFWLIEGKTFPKLTGKGVNTFGSPHIHRQAGYVDPERRTRVESQEMNDPSARLSDMDAEGIDVSVSFRRCFLFLRSRTTEISSRRCAGPITSGPRAGAIRPTAGSASSLRSRSLM